MERKACFGILLAVLLGPHLGSAEDKVFQKGATDPAVGTIVKAEDASVQISVAGAVMTIPRERIARVEIAPPASLKEGQDALKQNNWAQVVKAFEPLYIKYKGLPQDWIEDMSIHLGQAYVDASVKEWGKGKDLAFAFRKFYPESQYLSLTKSIEARALVGLNRLADAKVILEELTKQAEDEASKTKEGSVSDEQNRALGPAFVVLGKCYASANQDDKALEAFLKTTTIYYRDPAAVAEALWESAALFEKMKNLPRAKDQLEELVTNYAASPFAAEAKKKLESLKSTTP